MEQGIYGFPTGKNVTVNTQEFDTTGIWNKPLNAKLCFVEATGGGSGGAGSSGSGAGGGGAGVAFQFFFLASKLKQQEEVVIGAGGTGGTAGATLPAGEGGSTTFAGYTWYGGRQNVAARNGYHGGTSTNTWGSPGTGNANGAHGSIGAGGGAGGGVTSGNGKAGGAARTFDFGGGQVANTGGGATFGTVSSPAGFDANPANDRHGFGEGAGSGYGGVGGNGGKGRRGSGGGGAGADSANSGGDGGSGFIRILTYCWE